MGLHLALCLIAAASYLPQTGDPGRYLIPAAIGGVCALALFGGIDLARRGARAFSCWLTRKNSAPLEESQPSGSSCAGAPGRRSTGRRRVWHRAA